MEIRLQVVESGRADLLLLKELQKELPHLSRATLKILFQEERVRMSNRPLSGSQTLLPGSYSLEISDWEPNEVAEAPQISTLEVPPILYEDNDIFVFDKPSGMPSVPLDASETDSAVSVALKHLQGKPEYETFLAIGRRLRKPLEGGILHRLDTGTSGVLVFAKYFEEYERLKRAWKTDQVRKFYRVLVHAKTGLAKPPFLIDTEIAHGAKSSKKMISLPSMSKIRGNPLPARTHVLAIKPHGTNTLEVSVEIETGVMHQIRVHLSSIGLPILGDPLYGPKTDTSPRLMLHHERLDIPLRSGSIKSLTSTPKW
jgi:23S rRNA pseudouridine1911/1915/1917 synthase